MKLHDPEENCLQDRGVRPLTLRGRFATESGSKNSPSLCKEGQLPRRCAEPIPFPVARRCVFVSKLALQVMSRSRVGGEGHLQRQIKRQAC